MSIVCRSCLTQKSKDYFSFDRVLPEFGKKSILDILNIVTSSKITYSDNYPNEICQNCLKNLKNAYGFIILFENSQALLQKKVDQYYNNGQNLEEAEVEEKEKHASIVGLQGEDRFVIMNDGGTTYDAVEQEIFGYGETENKAEIYQLQSSNPKNLESINKGKIIMVSIDDVIKEEAIKKLRKVQVINLEEEKDNISTDEDIFTIENEDELDINETKQDIDWDSNEEEYFYNENEVQDSDEQEDLCSIECDDEQDINVDLLQMEENHYRNKDNIKIISIDDIKKEEEAKKTRVMSIDDVLKGKPREKPKRKRIKSENEIEIYACEVCQNTFNTRRKLMLHKLRIHNPNWEEKFKCHICGEQCKTLSAHKHHLLKHENKKYLCNLCDKSYITRSKLKEHVLRVHENKMDNKYLCTHCGRGFKFSNALQYHMKKHTNSKNYICRYCGFASIALSGLKRHERTHTGERPYACKYCNKMFAGAAERQKHEFGHEGIYRYKCKFCDKQFIQTYNMKVHWLQHWGPYICDICNRGFQDAEILQFHYAHSHKIKNVIIEDAEIENEGDCMDDYD